MESDRLEQRSGLETRSFRLLDDSIEVVVKRLITSQRFSVKYESIPEESVAGTTYSKLSLWALIILLGISVFLLGMYYFMSDKESLGGTLFYLFFAAIAAVRLASSRKRIVGFESADCSLLFFEGKPSPQALDSFLTRLIGLARAARTQVHPHPERSSGLLDELERLADLRDRGALSEAEFNELKAIVLRSVGVTSEELVC